MVDTSVWAAFFNGEDGPRTDELARLLTNSGSVCLIPLILTEVLQGFRTDAGFEQARKLLTKLPLIHHFISTHIASARLYRSLRRQGVTVRGTIDCLLAQCCIETGTWLFSADRDFRFIAEHSNLQLYEVPPSVQ